MIASLKKLIREIEDLTTEADEYVPNGSDSSKIDAYEKVYNQIQDLSQDLAESIVGIISRIEDTVDEDTENDDDNDDDDKYYEEDDE